MDEMTDKKRYVGIIFRESPMQAYHLTVEAISRKTLIPAGEIEQIITAMAKEMNISPVSMLKTVRFLGVIEGLCLNIISRYHLKQTKEEEQNPLSLPLLGHQESTHSPGSSQVVEAVQTVVLQRHRERPESPLPTPVAVLVKQEDRPAPVLSCGARFAALLKKKPQGTERKGVDKKAKQQRGIFPQGKQNCSGKTLGLRNDCMKTYPLRQDVGSVSKEFG